MKFLRLLRSLFRKERLDADMTEEMRLHLDMQAARYRAEGLGASEARHAAERAFGNVASLQQQAREGRAGAKLESLWLDVVLAGRSLRHSLGFAAAVVLSLALGIGVAAAVFSVARALLFSQLRYRAAEQLVEIQSWHQEQGASDVAPATFGDVAAANKSFQAVAAQYYFYVNLTGRPVPALLNSADVTAEFFPVFGVEPWRGRPLVPADFRPDAPPVVVLGYAAWQGMFGGDEGIIGTQVRLDDVSHTVVGIMPATFKDPAETAQLWRPMLRARDNLTERGSRYWTMFGRRKADVSLGQANAELAAIAERLRHAYPQNYENWTLRATDLRELIVASHRRGLLVLLAAVGCLLAIMTSNVAALSVLRILARRRELAVRLALGSSVGRIVRLLSLESLLLTLAGGAAGVLLAAWGVPLLLASLPAGWLPRADEVAVNLPVLLAGLALALLCGLLTAAVSGVLLARVQANDVLKEGSRGAGGRAAGRLRTGLIVAEIGIAIILLAGAGLLGRSIAGLVHRRPGLDAARLLTVTISQSGKRYDSPAKSWVYFSRALGAVAALPGVEAAGFTQTSPFRWGIPVGFAAGAAGADDRTNVVQAFTDAVTLDYFRAAGIPLRRGRLFTAADDPRAPAGVILSEAAARLLFGGADPVGRSISAGPGAVFTVIGVVGDVRRSGLLREAPPQVYRAMAQRTPSYATLMVRTTVPPESLAKPVQAALLQIDSETPVTDVATMDQVVNRSIAQPRLHLLLFGIFAGLALLLSAVGLYGLVAYNVEQRRREFGVRTALGATQADIMRVVLADCGKLFAAGALLGGLGALAGAQVMTGLVYDVPLYDPAVLLGGIAGLAAVAFLACWLPARRAAKVDPMVALRAE